MTRDEAFAFFLGNRPFPPDDEWTEDLARQLDEALECLSASRDPACIPLLLNCFGERDGWGRYEEVADLVARFGAAEVVPHLTAALGSQLRSVRYWAAVLAVRFPSSVPVSALAPLVEEKDEDCRSAAAIALVETREPSAVPLLQHAVATEVEPELRMELRELLARLEGLVRRGSVDAPDERERHGPG